MKHLPLTPQVFHILVALADRDQHGYSHHAGRGRKNRRGHAVESRDVVRLHQTPAGTGLDRARLRDNADERRRYYRLTPFGRKAAKAEAARMSEMLEQARVYGLAPKRG